MTFDPKKHLIRINGNREYLPVAARLIWFREDHPDWGIATEALRIDTEQQIAIFCAKIYNADGKLMATGTKVESVRGFPDYVEKAETGATGRALALCGYGTQFAPEFDEETRYADAPQAARYAAPQAPRGGVVRPAAPRPPEPVRIAPPPVGYTGDPNADVELPDSIPVDFSKLAPPGEDEYAYIDEKAPNQCSAVGCCNILSPSQISMTTTRFGRPLCLQHQREARPVAPGTAIPPATTFATTGNGSRNGHGAPGRNGVHAHA